MGRLASFVAKEALMGQKIVLVRCEELVISGSHMRNKRESDLSLVNQPRRGGEQDRALTQRCVLQ
jgi:ribosomal protein L13